jgi:hypothetical protein
MSWEEHRQRVYEIRVLREIPESAEGGGGSNMRIEIIALCAAS